MRRRGRPNPREAEQHGLHGHWPNMGGWLLGLAWIIVVLFWQCNDQLKIGLSWMEGHILPLVTDRAVSPQCRMVGPPPMSLGVRGMGS